MPLLMLAFSRIAERSDSGVATITQLGDEIPQMVGRRERFYASELSFGRDVIPAISQ
jgi:hypothetical protein